MNGLPWRLHTCHVPRFCPRRFSCALSPSLVGSDITGPRFWSFPCWSVADGALRACGLSTGLPERVRGDWCLCVRRGRPPGPWVPAHDSTLQLWAHVGSLLSSVVPGRGRTPGVVGGLLGTPGVVGGLARLIQGSARPMLSKGLF